MSEKNPGDDRLVWTGLRQMQSLRDAVAWSLCGEVKFRNGESDEDAYLNEQTANKWLKTQGLPTVKTEAVPLPLVGIVGLAINEYRKQLLGSEALPAIEHGRRTTFSDTKDFGTDRSGAGWSDVANFCITSAFLRLLGAWEQFELDVLKSLFYYRPTGESPGPDRERTVIQPKLSVVYEKPVSDPENPLELCYSFPPDWAKVRKKFGFNKSRRKKFKSKFQIEVIHGDGDEHTSNCDRCDDWYDRRNEIAHGRKRVTMTLAEYLEADVFTYHAMTYVAKQCLEKHKLLV